LRASFGEKDVENLESKNIYCQKEKKGKSKNRRAIGKCLQWCLAYLP
jgi:hypothetical protein